MGLQHMVPTDHKQHKSSVFNKKSTFECQPNNDLIIAVMLLVG